MKVTIIMPVSREEYLKRVFATLESLRCDMTQTNLLVMVDGDVDLFVKTRNMVEASKFAQRLCVFRKMGRPDVSAFRRRRKRIAAIHNEMKAYLGPCDFVFLLEDDTVIPPSALEKLLHQYTLYPHAGFISGVQINRWGFNVPGIWKTNNPYAPEIITSQLPLPNEEMQKHPTQEIDAAGLYCMLTKRDFYLQITFQPFEDIAGPDMYYGFELRKLGYKNYVDWSLNTGHATKKGLIEMYNTQLEQIKITKTADGWRTETL